MDSEQTERAARPEEAAARMRTGIAGLDDVLGGGFPVNRLYLIEGDPGTGKTTLAMQFLIEGATGRAGAVRHAHRNGG